MSGSLPGCPCSFFHSPPAAGPRHTRQKLLKFGRPRQYTSDNSQNCSQHLHRDIRPPKAAAAGDLSPADLPHEPSESDQFTVQIFPRRRERDPYRRLGVSREASFEEVQDARDFLFNQYRGHEHSRESIELAYDRILQEKMNVRHKFGFRPVRTGRKTDLQGEERLTWSQQLKDKFEPDVPGTTLVNDGSIFLGLALWSAWQSAAAEPTLPLGVAICFCAWKIFDKRTKRNPEGPYFGNTPVWGALGYTLLGLILGGLASWAAVSFLPLPKVFTPLGLGVFLVCLVLGATAIFLK